MSFPMMSQFTTLQAGNLMRDHRFFFSSNWYRSNNMHVLHSFFHQSIIVLSHITLTCLSYDMFVLICGRFARHLVYIQAFQCLFSITFLDDIDHSDIVQYCIRLLVAFAKYLFSSWILFSIVLTSPFSSAMKKGYYC